MQLVDEWVMDKNEIKDSDDYIFNHLNKRF